MISDLMKYYILDDLDKQIVRRIPYCLATSLIINIITKIEFLKDFSAQLASLILLYIYRILPDIFEYVPKISSFIWLWIMFFIFVISTTVFNLRINKNISDVLIDAKFNKFTKKMAMIFEGEDSLVDDIKLSGNTVSLLLGVTSGLSFFLLTTLTFSLILNSIVIDKNYIHIATILVSIYLYQNMAKSDLFNEFIDSETKNPFLFDVFKVYSIDNSLKSISTNSSLSTSIIQPLMLILSIIIAPLTHITIPKFSFDTLIVYKNAELSNLIKTYASTADDNNQIYMEHEDGLSLYTFLTETKGENITVLNEKSPKDVFPYFLDSKYKFTGNKQKKWIAFRLLRKNRKETKTTGYIFIHLFKGIQVKRKIRNKRARESYRTETKPNQIFFFIFIGERSDIQYTKTNIELNSVKFPLELMGMEWDIT